MIKITYDIFPSLLPASSWQWSLQLANDISHHHHQPSLTSLNSHLLIPFTLSTAHMTAKLTHAELEKWAVNMS